MAPAEEPATPPAVPSVELAPGVPIPRLINGCWQLAEDHREPKRGHEETLQALEGLARLGLTTFDGADIYTGVESTLGAFRRRWIEGGGDPGVLRFHTKFVPDLDTLPTLGLGDVRAIGRRSCQRLGVERLDLVQFHWWDLDVGGWVRTAGWLDELRREGRIRHLGVTNFDALALREILDAGVELVSNQVQVSLLDRRTERGTAELCRRHGIGLLAYGALAGGLLTDRWFGRPDPGHRMANRSLVKYRLVVDELGGWEVFQQLLRILDRVARKHGEILGRPVTIAQVALRWVLDRPGVLAVLAGTSSVERGRSNLGCFDVALDADDLRSFDEFHHRHPGPSGDVYSVEREVGGRHAAIMKTHLNRG